MANAPGSPGALNTTFFRAGPDTPDAPTAAINRYPGKGEARISAAHFHEVDQFQVIMDGTGNFGRHPVKPYTIHFSRAYTPYGPLQADKETGWAFMVLRSRRDSGAQRFPQSLEKLKQIPDRQPWQVTTPAYFPDRTSDVNVRDVPEIRVSKACRLPAEGTVRLAACGPGRSLRPCVAHNRNASSSSDSGSCRYSRQL